MRFSAVKVWSSAVFFLMLCAPVASGQFYPRPGSDSEPPVICSGCTGTNASGESNAGLPTWPYASPILDHTGRFVDSTQVSDSQFVFRTARARKAMVARGTRGSAPPRVYVQIGSAVVAYDLERFFTSQLGGGMTSLTNVLARNLGRNPVEDVLRWDALVYPELNKTAWSTPAMDGQDRMFDFDFDDRGDLYLAMGPFGFGIANDSGQSGGAQFSKTAQIDTPATTATRVFSLRIGANYYAAISNETSARSIFDVTSPSSLGSEVRTAASSAAFRRWAKDDANQRLAIVTGDKDIRLYDYATFVSAGAPLATFAAPTGKYYLDVAADDDGNFWTVEVTTATSGVQNRLVKFTRGPNGYTESVFDVLGGNFTLSQTGGPLVNYGAGYLAIAGKIPNGYDARLFNITSGTPVLVPHGDFFRNFYWAAPSGYAQPPALARVPSGMLPVVWLGRTYLMLSTYGLGDVFEVPSLIPVPVLSATPDPVQFHSPTGASRSATVTVRNAGTATLDISGVDYPAAPFNVTSDTCDGASLSPDATCTIGVSYQRSEAVQSLGSITISSNDPDHPSYVVDLVGDQLPAPEIDARGSASSVTLSWVSSWASVRIERSLDGTTFTPVAESAGSGMVDTAVVANRSYLYRAVGLEAGAEELVGMPDVATTMTFTDSPVIANVTRVKAIHLSQARSAVNSVRSLAGLAPAAGAAPVAGALIRANDVSALRTATEEARAALGLVALGWCQLPPVAGSSPVLACDVELLREAVR